MNDTDKTLEERLSRIECTLRAPARRAWTLAAWIAVVGLCTLPALGWAAVELTAFESGTPIVAADVNDNLARLNAALDGPLVEGPIVDEFLIEEGDPEQPIPNAVVDVETHGGRVHVQLVPAATSDILNGQNPKIGVAVPDGVVGGLSVTLERSDDGGDTWTPIFSPSMGGEGIDFYVPPGVFSFVDAPAEGSWRYRLRAGLFTGTSNAAFFNLRLAARELAISK